MFSNRVYIAVSLDGYIADKNNSVKWLDIVPVNEKIENEFSNFMNSIDCVVMGKNTFNVVKNFNDKWPYNKKVFVLSSSMQSIPKGYEDKIELLNMKPLKLVNFLNNKGYKNLYIDGGKTIQNFLEYDLIDEMIISTIPILLGEGKPLFSKLTKSKLFKIIDTKIVAQFYTQTIYKKQR
ncbi:diacylglycerol kinase [Malaciobacter halophilus]|uniref:Diacylglycerol kinase n=1 Tax=Malaciobacter halophilus TaxID=197482 RepID=A0A2N1J0H5_9BACT|nr:dihydrofolate reductase family protein [Malaciobacter halophilus]AXH08916.1 dihydrofolate reductase [Malaciobacter halophilus]PKI80068.1 diacylglycerol kinase [Malaciobacter halophilus]